jgi:hypothetical protein
MPGNEGTFTQTGGSMARRRTLNHKELRADFDAAERRKQEGDEAEGEELEDEEEGDEEEASDEEGEAGDANEEAPAKVKKPAKKKAAPKEPKPKRVRTPKVVRQKVVWVVFNNSNQKVATFDYPKKKEAEEHAAKLSADKKTTFFVQPVKENMDEK